MDPLSDRDRRNGWLRTLRVGDVVAVRASRLGEEIYSFSEVVHVTPQGKITVECDRRRDVFDYTGTRKSSYSFEHLEQVTKELRLRDRRGRAVERCMHLLERNAVDVQKLRSMPLDELDDLGERLNQLRLTKEEAHDGR